MTECNGKSAPKEADESNDVTQERINVAIKELAQLRAEYQKAKKIRNDWWLQESSLSVNIALMKIRSEELEKGETELAASSSEMAKQGEIVEQELKNLISQKILPIAQEQAEFQTKKRTYHDKFRNAQKEYSNESLSRDIEEYRKECMKINNELLVLEKQLEDLQTQSDLHNLNNEDVPEIVKIDRLTRSIRKDTDYKFRNITKARNVLKNLDKQIQHVTEKTQILKNFQPN